MEFPKGKMGKMSNIVSMAGSGAGDLLYNFQSICILHGESETPYNLLNE